MSDRTSKSVSRYEALGYAFAGSSGGRNAPLFATKADYEKMIRSHDWHELRPDAHSGPKTMVFYSGQYNAKTCDLNPFYERAAGVKQGETVNAYKVAQGQVAANGNYVILGDTKVGRALAQAENENRFTKQEMDALWSQASSEYAKAAANQAKSDRTAILSFTRNAEDGSVYMNSELPELRSNAWVVFTDKPLQSDGKPAEGDVIPKHFLNSSGGFTRH